MPVNVPTVTGNNISFGPAILYMGAAGTTPSVDVGAITEDGAKITVTASKKHIMQGNPKIPVYTFTQEQGVTLEITGIEWNLNKLSYALGSGNTTSGAGSDVFSFGGDPIVERVALHVQHYMAVSGHTLNTYIWQAVSDSGMEFNLNHDEHKFPMKFVGQRVSTDWAGTTLPYDEQLMRMVRIK